MSAATTSNNSQTQTPPRPLTARELLRELITRNLEIIETRTRCLWARSFVAYNTNKSQTAKDMLDALADLITAPFLRLGKQYRESPITQEIVAASRKFNNLLINAKREATLHIRGIAAHGVFSPDVQRKIERLGLRFPVIKLDIEELIASGEADAEAEADSQAQPQPPEPEHSAVVQITTNSTAPHPIDTAIAAELAKATAEVIQTGTTATPTAAQAPAATPTTPTTPPRTNPFGLPPNPENRKRNRFKKRRAA